MEVADFSFFFSSSSSQAPSMYASFPPSLCGSVVDYKQEVPHLQSGHWSSAAKRELTPFLSHPRPQFSRALPFPPFTLILPGTLQSTKDGMTHLRGWWKHLNLLECRVCSMVYLMLNLQFNVFIKLLGVLFFGFTVLPIPTLFFPVFLHGSSYCISLHMLWA